MSNRTKQRRSSLRPSLALALLSVLSNANAQKLTPEALFDLSLVELMQLDVTVTSLFDNTQLNAPSTVSVITEKDWQRRGARRTLDAIGNLPETMILPINGGADVIAIRGYAQTTSARGIATTLDGIPLNNFSFGTGQYDPQYRPGCIGSHRNDPRPCFGAIWQRCVSRRIGVTRF